MSERVKEECLDSNASHIGPARIGGERASHIWTAGNPCGPALIAILSPHMGVEILLKKNNLNFEN